MMMMMQSDGAGCRRGHGDGERKRNDNDASRVCIEKEKGVVEEREEEGGVEGVETDVSFRVDARHNRSLLDAGRQVELLQYLPATSSQAAETSQTRVVEWFTGVSMKSSVGSRWE